MLTGKLTVLMSDKLKMVESMVSFAADIELRGGQDSWDFLQEEVIDILKTELKNYNDQNNTNVIKLSVNEMWTQSLIFSEWLRSAISKRRTIYKVNDVVIYSEISSVLFIYFL